MGQENTPETSEAVQADAIEQGTPDTETASTADPTLNRAQRRAQARGKSAAPASPAGHPGGAGGTVGNRTGGHAGQVRFPRTGHK